MLDPRLVGDRDDGELEEERDSEGREGARHVRGRAARGGWRGQLRDSRRLVSVSYKLYMKYTLTG